MHLYSRVREIVSKFPEIHERESHGAKCFFLKNKKPLCYFHNNHRGDGRVSLWCPLAEGDACDLVNNDPKSYLSPAMSSSGAFGNWVGVYLDDGSDCKVDWAEVATLIEESFRYIAPISLVNIYDTVNRWTRAFCVYANDRQTLGLLSMPAVGTEQT